MSLAAESLTSAEIVRCVERLTAREQQIMILISRGLSNKEIAQSVDVAVGTVKMHLHNVYLKIRVSNRASLAALAIAYQLRP
jgi:two-component system nitrate/nitrite response regulator NarL